MKFTIEIDDEESLSCIENQVAENLASLLYDRINVKDIQKKVKESFEKKKKAALEKVELKVKSWDKEKILLELQSRITHAGWIDKIAKEVVKQMKYDTEFIKKISTEIIKSQFTK